MIGTASTDPRRPLAGARAALLPVSFELDGLIHLPSTAVLRHDLPEAILFVVGSIRPWIRAEMAGRTAQAAVCIVRVEPQPGHLLISVTTNRSLNRELYSASVEPTHKYSDPGDSHPSGGRLHPLLPLLNATRAIG